MRVIVVDDEPLARRGLRSLLQGEADVELLGECESAADAVSMIDMLQPDIVFLDIQMPGRDGLSLARSSKGGFAPLFIFVTAHSEHAATAFDAEAVDYVLKPVETSRLARACQRARQALLARTAVHESSLEEPAHNSTPSIKGRLVVHTDNRAVVVKAADIHWVEAAGNYVRLHAESGVFMVRETMSRLEVALNDEPFVRIHRSTMINLDSVKELQPWFSGEMLVIMKDNTKLKLSRKYRRVLEARVRVLA